MDYSNSLSTEVKGLSLGIYSGVDSVIYLSKSFYTVLSRVGGLAVLGNYRKLRETFSIRDIAEFAALNRWGSIISNPKLTESSRMDAIWLSDSSKDELSQEEVAEIRNHVIPLANDLEFLKGVSSFLNDDPDAAQVNGGFLCDVTESPVEGDPKETVRYKVVVLRNTVYIVVEEGFLFSIRESDAEGARARLAFLTDALKGLYVVRSIEEANHHELYHHYVKALVSKAKR